MEDECTVCNKKFQSHEALIQHLKDKNDEKHRLHNKKDESQSENCLNSESPGQRRAGMVTLLGRKLILKDKPNLTENEKAELEELTELIKEETKRTAKKLNKRFGLPEDTPFQVSYRLAIEESRLQSKEARREIEEIKIKTRAMVRESKEREEEFKLKMEQMKKDTWKAHEEYLAKNPQINYVETTPIKPEENIECTPCISSACPPPLKSKAKKNKLLHMATG